MRAEMQPSSYVSVSSRATEETIEQYTSIKGKYSHGKVGGLAVLRRFSRGVFVDKE